MFRDEAKRASAEYRDAAAMFEEMQLLRRMWGQFQPAPPLKRSDMYMLGTIEGLTRDGEQPVTISRLARVMHQSMPGVSQKVSMLEEMGFLRRTGDRADRRVAYIELTEQGHQMAVDAWHDMMAGMQRALERLGPDKTRQLLVLLQQLRGALEEQISKEPT